MAQDNRLPGKPQQPRPQPSSSNPRPPNVPVPGISPTGTNVDESAY